MQRRKGREERHLVQCRRTTGVAVARLAGAVAMVLLLVGASLAVTALPALGNPAPGGAPRVVASTAWTAAIAEAAGGDVVAVLAPLELRHPPERDFRPSDIRLAVEADAIVWAGYEGFMRQLMEAAEIPEDKWVRVDTQNTPDHLVALTRELASRWGTEAAQARWEEAFVAATNRIAEAAAAQNTGQVKVVSSLHLQAFLRWLGYDVVETFGFEEMTPARIHQLQQAGAHMVVDVWHNPSAESLAEALGARYVLLINFPGRDGTRTLLDVFGHNARQLGLLEAGEGR